MFHCIQFNTIQIKIFSPYWTIIYKAYKLDPNNILNDKLCFNTNALYDLAIAAEFSRKRN